MKEKEEEEELFNVQSMCPSGCVHVFVCGLNYFSRRQEKK